MKRCRVYGDKTYKVAVIHGGPGAPGEMAPVARELSKDFGVIEPFQTKDSIEGEVRELYEILQSKSDPPLTLIGYSWGAWLSIIFAEKYPSIVSKLILVSSGPFEEKYAEDIMKTRMGRLSREDKRELDLVIKHLSIKDQNNQNNYLSKIGKLISKADNFEPMDIDDYTVKTSMDIYQKVWSEAEELRKSGGLLNLARSIECPVTAVHGKYDPHPYKGVKEPLSKNIDDFKFILLEKCGHTPWKERHARDYFFEILKEEIVI